MATKTIDICDLCKTEYIRKNKTLMHRLSIKFPFPEPWEFTDIDRGMDFFGEDKKTICSECMSKILNLITELTKE